MDSLQIFSNRWSNSGGALCASDLVEEIVLDVLKESVSSINRRSLGVTIEYQLVIHKDKESFLVVPLFAQK